MNTRFRSLRALPLAVALALVGSPLRAQSTAAGPDDGRWHYAFTPYLWASAMEGEASFKGLPPQPVEMSFGDVWENLDFGALAGFEAHNGRWGLATDVVFMNLGAKVPLPEMLGQAEPGVDSRQFVAEADFLFRVHRGAPRQGMRSFVDLVAGARYNKVSAQISDHWTLGGGYRCIDTDYDKGSGTDRKLWSMVSKGPYLGVQIDW